MNKLTSTLILATALAGTLPALAQHQRISPHETVSAVLDGNRVTVVYGRPYTKDHRTGEMRKIWGGLVPYDKVWRTGADEATLFITQQPLVMGGATIPAGAYTLWTLPSENGTSKLIINKQIGQWGVGRNIKSVCDEANDLARVDLKRSSLDKPVHQFTIAIVKAPSGGGGLLKLMWEDTEFSVPFTVQKN